MLVSGPSHDYFFFHQFYFSNQIPHHPIGVQPPLSQIGDKICSTTRPIWIPIKILSVKTTFNYHQAPNKVKLLHPNCLVLFILNLRNLKLVDISSFWYCNHFIQLILHFSGTYLTSICFETFYIVDVIINETTTTENIVALVPRWSPLSHSRQRSYSRQSIDSSAALPDFFVFTAGELFFVPETLYVRLPITSFLIFFLLKKSESYFQDHSSSYDNIVLQLFFKLLRQKAHSVIHFFKKESLIVPKRRERPSFSSISWLEI